MPTAKKNKVEVVQARVLQAVVINNIELKPNDFIALSSDISETYTESGAISTNEADVKYCKDVLSADLIDIEAISTESSSEEE